ncbi:MAG: ISKra4 family transposase [Egibacteraceae bacterium]
MTAPADATGTGAFAGAQERFAGVLGWLEGDDAAALTHGELEDRLQVEARQLFRQLLADHLALRARAEPRLEAVVDAAGVPRGSVEAAHERGLATVFGEVAVERLAYRRRGHPNLRPADGAPSLPAERHSHGLRRLAALEACRGSFDAAVEAIERATGQLLGKRQVEDLAQRAVVDFDDFYSTRQRPVGDPGDALVLSCDGKGVVMRPDALRPATRKAAEGSTTKLATRLSKGEKRNRKRMAEVGAVYDLTPVPRSPADVLPTAGHDRADAVAAPTAKGKWLIASVTDAAATVVARIFDEADRRDPGHARAWVALVDGNNHQIDRIKTEAAARGVDVTIVVDFAHVLEYLWKAAWSFHGQGDRAAETWVHEAASKVLDGKAKQVAAGIRRKATRARLDPARRANADTAAAYLVNKAAYLDYPTVLQAGWPIATGVIEGACRHLVKDRMDITGARWGLPGAETVLKLRALVSNGDFDEYWQYHLAQEHQRVHCSRYADNVIPQAA